jgi:hypothetical protein
MSPSPTLSILMILSQKGDNSFKYGLIKVMHKYAILQMLIRDHAKFYGNQF